MNDFKAFDEDEAVKFIKALLPEDIRNKYAEDDILFIIDCIWDYYESNGFLSLSHLDNEEEELDITELLEYVINAIRKDGIIITDIQDIKYIVNAELEYEESLEDSID